VTKQLVAVAACLVFGAGSAIAQDVPAAFPPSGAKPVQQRPAIVPLDVQVVIGKYQGDKRISSVPYLLAVNANSTQAQLNIGSEVAVPVSTFAPVASDDKSKPSPMRSWNYRHVGTSISASAQSVDADRFELDLSIDETGVGTNAVDGNDLPTFKTFKARNKLLLRSGQSRMFTAATDRVSGETVRIEVSLTVVK
jgi:type II secretory pathway component GspD/PulD (secretin)